MNLKMAENSLFAVLLRSPWWVSLLVAAVVAGMSMLWLPQRFVVFGVIGGFPFIVIAAMAAWRQWRAPSPKRIAATLKAVNGLSSAEFANVMEAGFRDHGYEPVRLKSSKADFVATKTTGRITVASFKRMKAARLGAEPLRELQSVMASEKADDGLFVCTGEITDSALQFAQQNGIKLMQGTELAQWLSGPLARGILQDRPATGSGKRGLDAHP
jgi:restriction system protein